MRNMVIPCIIVSSILVGVHAHAMDDAIVLKIAEVRKELDMVCAAGLNFWDPGRMFSPLTRVWFASNKAMDKLDLGLRYAHPTKHKIYLTKHKEVLCSLPSKKTLAMLESMVAKCSQDSLLPWRTNT